VRILHGLLLRRPVFPENGCPELFVNGVDKSMQHTV
jgi:hypothetical protein